LQVAKSPVQLLDNNGVSTGLFTLGEIKWLIGIDYQLELIELLDER